MKNLVCFFFLLATLNVNAQGNESFERNYFVHGQVYVGGPAWARKIYNFSTKFQDVISFSGTPTIGGNAQFFFYDWLSAGVEVTYRRTTLSYDVTDSTLYNELEDKLGIRIEDYTNFNPFGTYNLDLKRLRVLAKVNFHFLPDAKHSDFYLNLGVGYNGLLTKFSKDGASVPFVNKVPNLSLPVSFRLGLGYSYYFINNLGVTAEVGLGGPLFSIGLSGRF